MKLNIEKEIDHRVQLLGYRLGDEDHATRDRIRCNIKREEAERKARLNKPVKTYRVSLTSTDDCHK
jgi:hypothetical protein